MHACDVSQIPMHVVHDVDSVKIELRHFQSTVNVVSISSGLGPVVSKAFSLNGAWI